MSPEVLVALLSLAGTLTGSLLASRLTTYRIGQLEKKVEKHNNLVERVALLEQSVRSIHKRLDELREERERV